jgi:hypothetical protein
MHCTHTNKNVCCVPIVIVDVCGSEHNLINHRMRKYSVVKWPVYSESMDAHRNVWRASLPSIATGVSFSNLPVRHVMQRT